MTGRFRTRALMVVPAALLALAASACKPVTIPPNAEPSLSPIATATSTPTGSPTGTPTSTPAGTPTGTPSPIPSEPPPGGGGDMLKDTNYPIPVEAYFVSPNGQAGNSGRAATSPWPVAKAIAEAPAGSTVVFRGGTYRGIDKLGISRKLTLQAYPHEKPWLSGAVPVTGWVRDGAAWRKDGWTHKFTWRFDCKRSTAKGCRLEEGYPLADHPDMVFYGDQPRRQVGSRGAVVAGTFFVDDAAHRLYVGDDPTAETVEAAASAQALGVSRAASAGTVVRGIGFTRFGGEAIIASSPHLLLENGAFTWNAVAGIRLYGSDNVIRGNTIAYNGEVGLSGYNTSRTLVEGNTIAFNNQEHFARTWSAAGTKFCRGDGLMFRGNLVEGNLAAGLWLDCSITNSTIQGNVAKDNEGIGLFYELSDRGRITGNLSVHNGRGIMLNDSSRTEIDHNTVVDNDNDNDNDIGIYVGDGLRRNTDPVSTADGVTWEAYGNTVHDNVLSVASGLGVHGCGYRPTPTSIAMLDRDVYQAPTKDAVRWGTGYGKSCKTYPTLPTLRAATGQEKAGIEVPASTELFVDPGHGDYRLRPGSAAAGRGANLAGG